MVRRDTRFRASEPRVTFVAPGTGSTENPPKAGVPSTFQARKPVQRLPADDALTVDEAANHAKVNRRTINRWLEQGSLNRYRRQQNRTVVSKRELDALLSARYEA